MTTEAVNPYPAVVPTSNGAGRASLIVAIVIVVVSLVQLVVSHLTPLIMQGADLDYAVISVVFAIFSIVLGILAIVGLILGIVGLGNSFSSRAAAGAGTAIAASTLITVVVNFILPFAINAVY